MRKMSLITFTFFAIVACAAADCPPASNNLQCDYPLPNVPTTWIQMSDQCITSINNLIATKLNNAVQYLALATYYLKDQVNRVGFGNLFIKMAYADRETAKELIDYMNVRGQYAQGDLINIPLNIVPPVTSWSTLEAANEYVLQFEGDTTELFHAVINTCETQSFDDYHVTNWFARTFLWDQYDELKRFADRASMLKKLIAHTPLGEFMLDMDMHFAILDDESDEDDE